MIVLQKYVEKKSVPIRPCALGNFKLLQLWSNLQSFTGVLKVTIRGYTPMYDTSFFTIFWACCNGDGPAAGFRHPTPTPPASHLILTIFLPPCMIHHFSWFFELVTMVLVLCMICMIFHDHFAWFCMILHFFGGIPLHITHHFPWFFEPVTIVLVLCMVCMILHDHISWFCMLLHFWGGTPIHIIHHFS